VVVERLAREDVDPAVVVVGLALRLEAADRRVAAAVQQYRPLLEQVAEEGVLRRARAS
jgi:hypothetical protein